MLMYLNRTITNGYHQYHQLFGHVPEYAITKAKCGSHENIFFFIQDEVKNLDSSETVLFSTKTEIYLRG